MKQDFKIMLQDGENAEFIIVSWLDGNVFMPTSLDRMYRIRFNPQTELLVDSQLGTYSTEFLLKNGWFTTTTEEDVKKQIESQKFDSKVERLLNE